MGEAERDTAGRGVLPDVPEVPDREKLAEAFGTTGEMSADAQMSEWLSQRARAGALNALDGEFHRFTSNRADMEDSDRAFKFLDEFSERRFGVRGERGLAWTENGGKDGGAREFGSPEEYAGFLRKILVRGYTAIESDAEREWRKAKDSGDRAAMIRTAGIETMKMTHRDDGTYAFFDPGMGFDNATTAKSDDEIDDELRDYDARMAARRFGVLAKAMGKDFAPEEMDIAYAALRHGDGLPPERAADYYAVLKSDPDKARRLSFLIEASRRREPALARDVAGALGRTFRSTFGNFGLGEGPAIGLQGWLEQSFTDAFLGGEAEKRIRDARIDSRGYNMLWNDEEKAEYDRLMAERGPDPEFGDALVRNGIDYKAHRRMVREALPLAERARIRKEELAMDELVSHRQYEGYGYVARTAIGIASTLPYMAFTAVPVAGFAGNVASQFQEISDDVLMRGGDPDEAEGWKWASAILWAGIEKAQLGGVVGKPMTALQKRMRFIREIDAIEGSAAARKGLRKLAAAIRAGAAETGATMVAESAEEGGQGFVEAFTREMLLSHDPSTALDKAGAQGLNDFVESLGTMAVIGGFGAAKKMATVRTAQLDAESLGDYAARRLQVMNTLRGQTSSPGADAEAPGRVRRALDDMKDIWKASSDHVAALDQIREKYGFTDEQLRNVADYLDMQDAILAIARNQDDAGTAYAYASFAGGAFPIGRPGAHFDPQSLYDLILPGAKVEDVEVPDLEAEPTVEYTPEQIAAAEEARAAQAAVNDAKVGSARRGAERRLRRAKERLARANANAPAPVHPLRKAQKITLPDGSSYVIERDTSAPDVHTASFAASVEQAMSGAEGLKGGASVSLDEFKAMSVDEKMGVAVTAEQYMAMSEAERESYLAQYDLAEGGSMRILDAEGKELLGADAVVKIKRGYAKFVRTGGNWELAHEHGHFISAVARKTMTDAQKETMRRLFGAARPGVDEEWNEEVANDGLAEWLRGKYDFRRSTRAERRAKMNWFQRLLDTVKGFFALTGEEAPEAPVERTMREQAEDAAFEALKNGDFSGLDRFAGIEFGEDVDESARKDEELVQRESPENQGRNASVDESGEQSPKLVHETATAPTVSKTAPSVPNTAPSVPKADTGATAAENAALRAKIAELQAQLASRPGAVTASQPVRTGSKMTVFTPGYEMSVEAEPMWVPLASLVESTGDREVQMRDRSRMATDQQVLSKTRKGVFQPLALFPKSKSDDGAPIVGGGLNIISGHGRKRMLEQLVKEGRFGEYLDAVNSEAERQGLPSAPEGMENPVLVLRVTGGLETRENLTRFAELSNRWGGLERSGAEHAESDARKITPALLRLYSPDASGNLLAASNRPFMAAFLKEVGATGLTNKDGTPTAEAALRVQRAMMAAVFGSDDKVRDMVQNLMERSGELSLATLQNALMRSAGKLLAMKRQKGSFDIVDDVREAAYQYIAWRVAQQKNPRLSLADHLNQSDFFTSAVPALQQALARLLEVERFGGALDRYAELVAQEAVDEQSTFGFFEKHTPLQLLGMAERALLAEGETPVTPDPASAEAAAPVQTPPAVQKEDVAPAPSSDPVAVAQQVLAPQPATFTPVSVKRGAATLPGPGAAQFPASQVNADGQPTTKVRMLPAGAWNLLRPAYDTGKPPAPSAQDRAGRGLGISRPAPTGHADIFPHFQGNKTEMAARTSQAIRNTMSDAERAHYTTIVDYFGGGGCWGLYHALENFPNVRQLVVNEFDPDRVGKIRLLHEIDGQVADEAAALLEPYMERLRTAAQDSSSPVTIASKAEALVKREIEDEHQRAVLQAFIDCAKTMLATSKDADGNPINDIRLGVERALAALREDGRRAKAAADEFKARGGRISYRSGDAAAFDDAPSGHHVMAVADPPYYLTADYQQNTILGLDEVPDNWSYRATQNLLHKLVAKGDGILYTDEAWWFKEGYVPDRQEDLFGGGSTFQKEQEVLLDIINTLDHFDVAGRVVGRQEVLGVHHGHTTDEESENGADGNAAGSASADNGGREQGAGQPVLGVAEVAEGQGGNDGTARKERGRDGAGAAAGRAGAASGNSATGSGTDGASPGLGARAIAREVVVQDVAASIEDASPDSDPGSVDALVRHSVRQVREARMADYARTVSRNAKRWLKDAAMRLDERMAAAGFTEKVWHGTYGEDFNVFRFTSGNHEVPAAYFTYNRGTAQNYAAMTGMLEEDDDASDAKYNTRQFYINPGKRYEHDERKNPTTLAEFKQLLADLYAQGYNSVLVRHAIDDQGARLDEFDNGPMTFLEPDEMPGDGEGDFETDILIVMQQPGDNAAARIKAADPVTFFEDGLPIPLEFRADQTMQDVRFSVTMGKNAREEARRMIEKYRPNFGNSYFVPEPELDLYQDEYLNLPGNTTTSEDRPAIDHKFDEWLKSRVIDKAIDSIAAFETPKERKCALLWFCKNTIRLPEDSAKVTEAIKTAERAKVDPMQFESPGEILLRYFEYRPKEPRIDPETVPELTDRRDMGQGVVTYLVQDDKAGQAAMRRIIDTHWGKEANPWCLLQGDGVGKTTERAWTYWQHYSALPKRVAFKDGKLLAFMATDKGIQRDEDGLTIWRTDEAVEEWWDRSDDSHAGIPFERSVPGDSSSGKTTETVELMSDGEERVIERKRTRTAEDGTKTEEFWDGTGNRALKYKRTITYPGGSHEVTEKYEAVERTAFYDAEGHFVAQTERKLDGNLVSVFDEMGNTKASVSSMDGVGNVWQYGIGNMGISPETADAYVSAVEDAVRRGDPIPPPPTATRHSVQARPMTAVEIARAVEYFGTTEDPKDAAFILYDGRWLDYEQMGEHWEISQAFNKGHMKQLDALQEFEGDAAPYVDAALNAGLVRVTGGVFDLRGNPTETGIQLAVAPDAVMARNIVDYVESLADRYPTVRTLTVESYAAGAEFTRQYDMGDPRALAQIRRDVNESLVRHSVASRRLDWDALPNLHGQVVNHTSIGHLEQAKFKDERKAYYALKDAGDLDGAEALARKYAADGRTEWLGKFLLAKHHADDEAAVDVVEHVVKPSVVDELRALLDPSRRIAVMMPMTNFEGSGYNRLPFAYAEMLAGELGGRVDGGLLKVSAEHNTRVSTGDRASREFAFDTDGVDLADSPQLILVDDTWTSGQTLVSALDALLAAHPDADVVAMTALATGRYGKNVKPTEDQLTSVLERANISDVASLNEALGFDIRKATGSELQLYRLSGKRGADTLRDLFAPVDAGAARGARAGEEGGASDHNAHARDLREAQTGPVDETPAEREAMRHSVFMGTRGSIVSDTGYDRLQLARKMLHKAGEKYTPEVRDEIYKKTGWWKGTDGEWRIEIPDMKPKTLAELPVADFNGEDAYAIPLTDLVSNGRLFKAYPELKNSTVWILNPDSDAMDGISGSFDGSDIVIDFDAFTNIDPADGEIKLNYEGLQTLTHEVQHFVQYIERFAAGGSVKALGVKKYTRLAGEVEARNAERRVGGPYGTLTNPRLQNEANWTDMVKYGNAPWQTEDVPTIDQLLYDRQGGVNTRAWFNKHPGQQAQFGGWMDESQSADSVRSSVTRGRSARLDDLAVAYVAQRHLAGKEAKVEDVDKLLKNLGLGALNASELSARAKALADTNREVARSLVERNSTELVAHLRAASMSDRLTSALDAAITGGAKAADPETGRLLAEAVQSRQTIDLMCAKGFTAAQMMAELPIDLAKAVLAVGEYERTPEEAARLEEARREREKEREEEKAEAEAAGMTVKELRAKKAAEAEDDSSYREPSAEQKAALDELMDRARFAEEARRDEAERKRRLAEKRREEREGANADDDGGVEGGTGDINDLPDVPLDTVKRIAPVFESPELFAQFVIEWTGDHIVARHPELPNTAEMWKSPVAIRELKQTATHILRDLAINALGAPTGNHARNFADHIINELESDAECRTYNAVRRKISYIYGTIHDDALRISRRKLVENLIVNIRREAGAKGRFSAITEDMQRVVDGKTELWGRRLVRYLTMSEENLSEEISRLRSIVENDPTRDDAGDTQLGYVEEAADKLAIALKYGGMIRWMPGKISEAADEIMGLLKGRRQAFEQRREQRKARNEAIRKALIDAIENGAGGVFREKDGGVSRYLQSMQGNLTLEMQNLIRFCKDPALRQAALEAIEALQIEISEASARYRVVLGEAQRQLREGLSAVYGDADAGMRHLLGDEIPEEAARAIFKTRVTRPTYGQLLQLYATTIQSDYRENAETHGRTEQLPMMEATLTDQDKRFHAWAVEWYRQARQSLSDAVEAVTGLPIRSPDARYTPARMDDDPDGVPAEVVAWSPIPRALNRRIRHARDFKETVNFLSMLQEQAEIRAQTIGYSETGILLRDTIANREVQAAARKNVGEGDMKRVTDHVRDVLVQGAAHKGESAFFAPVNAARAWMARFYLSGNIPSAIKQLASMPVWANALLGGREIGFSGVLRYLTTVGTEEGRAAVRELMESDGYRARYVMGWSEETQNVLQNPSRTKFVRAIAKVLDKGMIVNKFVDGVSCLWMAQGFYRDATANFLAKGFDEAEAKRRAMALTWSCLESGQQSGRVENMNAIQRDKGATGAAAAAIFQFKTAFLLQNNYLFQALREWRAGTPGAKGRFLRAATINGLYIPAFCMAVNALWKAILGDEPPEEDPEKMPSWFKEMAWSMVNGVTAPMFGVSMAAHSLYDAVTGSHNYASDAGLPAVEGMVRTVRHGATVFYDLGHGALERVNAFDLEDEVTSEKIKGDVDRLLRDLAAPYRHGSKLYQNRVGDE